MKRKVDLPGFPAPKAPYSPAIVAGDMVFTAGVIYLTPEGKLLTGTIEEQVHQIMKNLKAILEEAGSNMENVVKTTIYVTDMSIYGKVNQVYGSYFQDPYPARETVCVKELPLGAKIEISMIAVKS